MSSTESNPKILSRVEIDKLLSCAMCSKFPQDIHMCSACGDLVCLGCTKTVNRCPRCQVSGPRTLFPARFAQRLASAIDSDFAASEAALKSALDASNKRIAETVLSALRAHVQTCKSMMMTQLQAEQLNHQVAFLQQLQQDMLANSIPPSDPRVTMRQQQFMMNQNAQSAVRMRDIDAKVASLTQHVATVEAGLATHSFFNPDGTIAPCNPLFTFGKTSVWPDEAASSSLAPGADSMGMSMGTGSGAPAAPKGAPATAGPE